MHFRPLLAALPAALIVGCLGPTAATASPAPTRSQIRSAINRATSSRQLWATINICNTKAHPDTVGIRGQIPTLGFQATLSMLVEVDYWNNTQHQFVPDPAVPIKMVSLGRHAQGVYQSGYTLTFRPPATFRGKLTFRWALGRRVIGQTQRLTAAGATHVDGADPPGYSAAACNIR